MKIILEGSIPSKKNSKNIIRRGGRTFIVSSDSYIDWEDRQMWALKGKRAIKTPCSISITIFPENMRRGDLDNKATSILDLLCKAEIIPDDNFKEVPELHLFFGGIDAKKPRAEIEINPL